LYFGDEVVVVFFRAFFFDENLRAIKVEKLLVQFFHFLQQVLALLETLVGRRFFWNLFREFHEASNDLNSRFSEFILRKTTELIGRASREFRAEAVVFICFLGDARQLVKTKLEAAYNILPFVKWRQDFFFLMNSFIQVPIDKSVRHYFQMFNFLLLRVQLRITKISVKINSIFFNLLIIRERSAKKDQNKLHFYL